MISVVIYFVFWLFIWCVLSWPIDAQELIIGIAASIFVTFMSVDLAAAIGEKSPAKKYDMLGGFKKALWLVFYIFVFLWECIKANIDVAYRVLHPDLPIRPGTIKVRTSLKSDIGLTFLANSITLTPGTTTVDVDKEKGVLYIHWIYVKDDCDDKGWKLPVVEKFENILKKVFE